MKSKQTLRPRLGHLLWSLCIGAIVAVGGSCTPDDNDDSPHKEDGTLRTIEVVVDEQSRAVVMNDDGTGSLTFRVKDSNALFNYSVASGSCDVELRLAENPSQTPSDVAIESITKGSVKGEYVAWLKSNNMAIYSIELRLAIAFKPGSYLLSDNFELQSFRYALSTFDIYFSAKLNPALGSDLRPTMNTNGTLEASTPTYLRSMELVASFSGEGIDRVEVAGEPQTSGQSVNDFSEPLTYTVYSANTSVDYVVDITNFTGLPVMWVETPNGQGIYSKEEWIEGSRFFVDGLRNFDDLEEVEGSIRGRGNSTWGYDKKPYNIKFEKKQSVLGMPKHKRWCLLANYMDRTLMRNLVAYELARYTSLAWTPRCEFVELFVNGEHYGQYLLTEHIKVDENRVNITEMEPTDIAGEALTGGYMLELDFHFDNVWQWYSAHGTPFSVTYPDDDEIVAEQVEWIKNHIATMEDVIYSNNFAHPTEGYAKYLDAESFVDYWLIYELCVNHEIANPGSVYMHKDRGGKMYAGPVWDFDWGTFSYNASPQAQWGLFMTHAWWYSRLFNDPNFKALAKERWSVLKPKFEQIFAFIDEQEQYIAASEQRNSALWTINTTINGDEKLPWHEAVDRMRTILTDRIKLIDRDIRAF